MGSGLGSTGQPLSDMGFPRVPEPQLWYREKWDFLVSFRVYPPHTLIQSPVWPARPELSWGQGRGIWFTPLSRDACPRLS